MPRMTGQAGKSTLGAMDKPDFAVDDPPAAFARFKQVLQRTVSVSKEEFKRREAAYKRMRKAKRRKPRQTAVAHSE